MLYNLYRKQFLHEFLAYGYIRTDPYYRLITTDQGGQRSKIHAMMNSLRCGFLLRKQKMRYLKPGNVNMTGLILPMKGERFCGL